MRWTIEKDIYDRMLGVCPVPPETGGIIGGESMCISKIVVEETRERYRYIPNVDFLNKTISEWRSQGISFYGMFHSHPEGCERLSKVDEEYIHTIMDAMPAQIDTLMFPLILPGDKIIPFIARRTENDVAIEQGELAVVESCRSY